MFLGYNTNGFSYHRLDDAIAIIADLGYRGVGLTLDVHHLDPFRSAPSDIFRIRDLLEKHELRCVVETGSRFLLDSRRKHQPTLLNRDETGRGARRDFLERCIGIAAELNADCVSFWSGAAGEPEGRSLLMNRLRGECRRLADAAGAKGVQLAFEPEPGMLIDTMESFAELRDFEHPHFGLTLDVGHLVCMGEPVAESVRDWKEALVNVHLDDMRPRVHDHRMFGEGAVDFVKLFQALDEIAYPYGAYVELSRHAHDAVRTAESSHRFLEACRK